MKKTTAGRQRILAKALRSIDEYTGLEQREAQQSGRHFTRLSRRALGIQANRAVCCAERLAEPGVLVLNDPVGSGKTLVALVAARLLLGGHAGAGSRLKKIVIVAPSRQVADLWVCRARTVGLNVHRLKPGERGTRYDVLVVTFGQLSHRLPDLPKNRDGLLVIVDEAHRSLHNQETQGHKNVRRITEGARVLLVTATPFQLTSNGLENLLEIDGDGARADLIREYGRAVRDWLLIQHRLGDPRETEDMTRLEAQSRRARKEMIRRLREARPDLLRYFMPRYPRSMMGMPKPFEIPERAAVDIDADWAQAYHVARILPEFLPAGRREETSPRNSDAYMRMLNSSFGAWADSAVVQHAQRASRTKELTAQLKDSLGAEPLKHPKVAFTANLAVKNARPNKRRHVLIFSVYKETQNDLEKAINELVASKGLDGKVRVAKPENLSSARKWLKKGFNRTPSKDNPPIVMIVRDNLSESIDLDGGTPVVIHHDLSWSPVRWTQRMGRVIRASTAFQGPEAKDVHIPLLATDIDERMYGTLRGRDDLTRLVVPDDLRRLLEETLPDMADID